MLVMSGKTAEELCALWKKYRAIRDANDEMVRAVFDDINDAMFAADPQACYEFTKALGRDPDADPAPFFGVVEEPAKRLRGRS